MSSIFVYVFFQDLTINPHLITALFFEAFAFEWPEA